MSTRRRRYLHAFALVALSGAAWLSSVAHAGPASTPPVPKHRAAVAAHDEPTLGERVARIARRAVGVPYRWGGTSPGSGFDCSGLVYWAYRRVGITVPHSSYALSGVGRRVTASRLRPGDVLLFDGLGHVGLYLGRGRMVHAPETGRRVEVVRLARTSYGARLVGARRVVRQRPS